MFLCKEAKLNIKMTLKDVFMWRAYNNGLLMTVYLLNKKIVGDPLFSFVGNYKRSSCSMNEEFIRIVELILMMVVTQNLWFN